MRRVARVCIRSGNTARWKARALQRYILTHYSWITVYTVKSRYVPVILWTLLEIVASVLLMSAWYFVGIRLMKRIVHETLSFKPFSTDSFLNSFRFHGTAQWKFWENGTIFSILLWIRFFFSRFFVLIFSYKTYMKMYKVYCDSINNKNNFF